MFRNVVIGMDGGPGGRDALALARRLAAPGATLTLATVYPNSIVVGASSLPWDEAEEREALEVLEAERAAAGVPVELACIGAKSPGEGLHRLAEQREADLLVVGSSRQGAIGRVLVGDQTRAALNGAPCAVAIAVRGYATNPTRFVRIGVGYDFSPESELALAAARELGRRDESEIEVLNAVYLPLAFPRSAAVWASIQPDAIAFSRRTMQEIPGVTGTSVAGPPKRELERLGQRVDLLVVGSRGYGPVCRMVLGSTSTHLQRHAPCSVLVVPRGARADSADGASSSAADLAGAAR